MTQQNQPETENTSIKYLLHLCIIVFIAYLVLGLSFGILPGFITNTLHYNSVVVGIALGIESVATLATRHLSGTLCDTQGSKHSAIIGLLFFMGTGFFYLLSNATAEKPIWSISLLLLSRILLGFGESFLITGALSWGIGLMGVKRSGKVMAWNGIAMYGGLAFGAPIGIAILNHSSLTFAYTSTLLFPGLSLAIGWMLKAVTPIGSVRVPFYTVIKSTWRQGTGLALSAIGFGVIASFITLYFAQQQWQNASLSLTIFGLTYIVARIPFAHFPDKYGGRIIAIFSLVIEVAGLLGLWLATSQTMAFVSVALAGAGFSLVFPSLGVEAVKQVAPQNRGAALGAYAAFFDLALGITGPVAGVVADKFGFADIYLLAAFASIISILIIYYHPKPSKNE